MHRREFTRLLALGGSASLLTPLQSSANALPPSSASPDEKYWKLIREQFLLPDDLTVLNAANLCPASGVVLEALYRATRDIDQNPSAENREKLRDDREATRQLVADFLRVSPEEVVLTRNSSESNNLISNGIDLGAGDEVIICSDNHPSNRMAWHNKAKRFGFLVREVPALNPHPGPDHYVEAFKREITSKTKLITFTHLTNTVGDLFPAREICRLAHERGILVHLDGAQTFGLLDVDLSDLQPDFYCGSAHKWPCGPKEVGVLYINRRAHSRIWPSIYSAYPGQTGISKTFEGMGQRNEPAMIAFTAALKLQLQIGRPQIEQRSRELAQALMEGLRSMAGVKIWTHADPARSAAILAFQPGDLDAHKLSEALYRHERIGCAMRGGTDRPGLRLSPHFYNTHADIEKTLAAIRRYLATGV